MIRRKFKRWIGNRSELSGLIDSDADKTGDPNGDIIVIGGYRLKGKLSDWGSTWPPRQVEIEVIIREVK